MPEHYYSKNQTSELRITEIEVRLRGNILKLHTGSGVFAIGKVDKGTELLIDECIINENSDILDLGCGYGVVGISIAKAFPSVTVLMTDINQRAIKLSKMNIKLNGIDNVKFSQSDLYSKIKGKFDTILTNPPQLAGKKVCFEIIEKSKEHLVKNGSLQLVSRHNKGGKQLELKMKEVFGNVEVLGRKAGYRIYSSKNK